MIDQVIEAAQRIVVVGDSIGANPTEIGDGRIGRITRRGQDWRGRTADVQDIGEPVVRLVDVDLGDPAGVARGSIKMLATFVACQLTMPLPVSSVMVTPLNWLCVESGIYVIRA